MAVTRFPYHVVYLEVNDRIRILAVAHDRRKPGYWKPVSSDDRSSVSPTLVIQHARRGDLYNAATNEAVREQGLAALMRMLEVLLGL